MTEARWTAYDSLVTTYFTSGADLNNLGINANKLGAAINFAAAGADRKIYMDIEVNLASAAFTGNSSIYLWILARTDGTNYEDGGDSLDPARQPDVIIPVIATTAAHRVFARRVLTTPDHGKILLENRTGVALASSGNTLKYYLYSEEHV